MPLRLYYVYITLYCNLLYQIQHLVISKDNLNFTLKQLQIFVEVVDSGSALAASKKLSISQPAVSSALAGLEKNLNTPLFHRWKKRIVLNDRGRDLVPMARLLLVNANDLSRMFGNYEDNPTGTLRVGASTTPSSYILPIVISKFVLENPQVKIDSFCRNKTGIISQVEDFSLDIGVIAGVSDSPYVKNLTWLTDELCVFSSTEHPIHQLQEINLQNLFEYKWVTREKGSGTLEAFIRALSDSARLLDVSMTFDNLESIKKAVESGNVLGCISRFAIKREIEMRKVKIVPTPFLDLSREYSFLVHRERHQSQLLNHFMSHCFKEVSK